jgi:Lrp/AsnC family leucine-responsive transcriptional regulator
MLSIQKSPPLDPLDWKLLALLSREGRLPWSELARQLKLSPPAAAERVKRLEKLGVIEGYAASVNPRAVGLSLLTFLGVVLEHPRHRARFLRLVKVLPEILECHHVTGEFDYLLKVRCRDTEALEGLISHRLKAIRALVRTTTMIALSSIKESIRLPTGGSRDR